MRATIKTDLNTIKRVLVELSGTDAKRFLRINRDALLLNTEDMINLKYYVDTHCYDVADEDDDYERGLEYYSEIGSSWERVAS